MKTCNLLSIGVNALVIAICSLLSSCAQKDLEVLESISDNLVHCIFTAGVPSNGSNPATKVALEGDAASQPIIVKWKGSSVNFKDSFALVLSDSDGGLFRYTASRLSSETEDDVNGTFETTAPENKRLSLVYPNKEQDATFLSGNDWDKDNWVYSIENQTGLFEDLSNYIFMAGENTVMISDGEMLGNIRFQYETAILRVSNLNIPELAGKTISNFSLISNAICSSIAYRSVFYPYSGSLHEVKVSNSFQIDCDGRLSDNVYFVFFPSDEPIDVLYIKAEVEGKSYTYTYDGNLNSFSAGKVYTLNNKTMVRLVSPDYSWYKNPISSGVYELSSAADLLGFANLCNGTSDALSAVGADEAISFAGEIVRIKSGIEGIDLSTVCNGGQSWVPIENFQGTFDGNGVPVTSLFINQTLSSRQHVGFFSDLVDATVQNFDISGRIATNGGSEVYIGGITGYARSSRLLNCRSGVDISHTTGGETRAGGICGLSHGSCYFIGCSSTSTVTTSYKNKAAQYVGGIDGHAASSPQSYYIGCSHTDGEITCYSSGYENYSTAGGILGVSINLEASKIVACYNSAKIIREYPGAILGGILLQVSRTPDITSSYYTSLSGCKGVGQAYHTGFHGYDYGTTRITDPNVAIEDMNAAIVAWNSGNADYLCNVHYEIIDDEICLLAGAPSLE